MTRFHEVRRQDRLLSDEQAKVLLQTGEYGFLSLGEGGNGYAYGVPLSYAYSETDNALYFHCAPEGHKLDNLRRNNKVSFCVVGRTIPLSKKFSTIYESVIVFGRAGACAPGEDKRRALTGLLEKYCPDNMDAGKKYIEAAIHKTHVVKIEIDHITAKARQS